MSGMQYIADVRTISSLGAAGAFVTAAALSLPAAAAPAGTPGNKSSYAPDISANGRYVVFASDASNLVAGDTNGKRDIFIRDLQSQTTRLVSKGRSGPSNGMSTTPKVSDDGRYVSFLSTASNLVARDSNGKADAFRVDTTTGTIIRVSVGAGGVQANGASEGPRISANGNSIVFGSAASNLVRGDTNKVNDIFLRDVSTGQTRRLSMTPQGNQNLAASDMSSISPNGSIASWRGPVGLHHAVFSWDRASNTVRNVAESNSGDYRAIRTSNAGPSWLLESYVYPSMYWEYKITAAPKPASFRWFAQDPEQSHLVDFDVPMWGAMGVFARSDSDDPDNHGVVVADTTGELAVLGPTPWNALGFSSDGNHVVGADESTGQIKRWSWRTGVVTIVSVN